MRVFIDLLAPVGASYPCLEAPDMICRGEGSMPLSCVAQARDNCPSWTSAASPQEELSVPQLFERSATPIKNLIRRKHIFVYFAIIK